jgi:hypothetical protein
MNFFGKRDDSVADLEKQKRIVERRVRANTERAVAFAIRYAETMLDLVFLSPQTVFAIHGDGNRPFVSPFQLGSGKSPTVRDLLDFSYTLSTPPEVLVSVGLGFSQMCGDNETQNSIAIVSVNCLEETGTRLRQWTADGPVGPWADAPERNNLANVLVAAMNAIVADTSNQIVQSQSLSMFGKRGE